VDGVNIDGMLAEFTGGEVGLRTSDRILTVRTDTTLRHTMPDGAPSGDHGDIGLDAGVYVVRRQREYDPERERLIAD